MSFDGGWNGGVLRRARHCLAAVLLGALSLPVANAAEPRWTLKDVGFSSPSAVRFDPAGDRYLVPNIKGPPLARDGNGFSSWIGSAGEVRRLKWIQGGRGGVTLDAPKSITIRAGRLYLADIDVVRVFDLTTGARLGAIAFPGVIALTDVAATADGGLLVSDIGRDLASGAIFEVDKTGKVRLLARGDRLLRPNALAATPQGVVCAPSIGGWLFSLDRAGKVIDGTAYPKSSLPNWPPRSLGRLSRIVLVDDKTTALAASKEGGTAFVRWPATVTVAGEGRK